MKLRQGHYIANFTVLEDGSIVLNSLMRWYKAKPHKGKPVDELKNTPHRVAAKFEKLLQSFK